MPSHLSSDNFSGTLEPLTPEQAKYEQVWEQVDEYTIAHLHAPTRDNTALLVEVLKRSLAHGLPDHSVNPAQGKFLAIQCRALGAKQALEIGTLGGYSAIWLALLNPELHVTTLEINAERVQVARANVQYAGLSDRITIIEGAAKDSLVKIEQEVQAGTRKRFDFMFIDADKRNNWEYFDTGVRILRSGSLIYVDNVVRWGRIVTEPESQAVLGAREVVEKAGKDPRVEAIVMQMVAERNHDGFMVAVVL